jgi:hypothetical protein
MDLQEANIKPDKYFVRVFGNDRKQVCFVIFDYCHAMPRSMSDFYAGYFFKLVGDHDIH